jgi:hypothetical protein
MKEVEEYLDEEDVGNESGTDSMLEILAQANNARRAARLLFDKLSRPALVIS